jgi:diguanylate cyclase
VRKPSSVMRAQPGRVRYCDALLLLLACLLFGTAALAAPEVQQRRWVQPPAHDNVLADPVAGLGLLADGPALKTTGGVYWHELQLRTTDHAVWVVDFSHSAVLAGFRHYLFDAGGELLWTAEGGLGHAVADEFFMRHGRRVELPAGSYRLLTRLDSPFFIAPPLPTLIAETEYEARVHRVNSVVLIGLGIFIGLGFYYLVMGLWRRSATDLCYAGFIVGNLLYNASALLVLKGLFGPQWFYLISVPILFSNALYVLFVMRLLSIGRSNTPRLFALGVAALLMLALFWPLAWLRPDWSLELARVGVFVFGLYGFVAGIVQSLRGNRVAWFYLIANAAFLIPALIAIGSSELAVIPLFQIEHLGLVAVLIEVLLLAQVMSYQVGRMHQDKLAAQAQASSARALAERAQHDPLTGLPGRALLEQHLDRSLQLARREQRPLALLFFDQDDLKPLNDSRGHQAGDALLIETARRLRGRMRDSDALARVGGDEFVAVLYPIGGSSEALDVGEQLCALLCQPAEYDGQPIRSSVSIGIAVYPQHGEQADELMRNADRAMYRAKQTGGSRVAMSDAVCASPETRSRAKRVDR